MVSNFNYKVSQIYATKRGLEHRPEIVANYPSESTCVVLRQTSLGVI